MEKNYSLVTNWDCYLLDVILGGQLKLGYLIYDFWKGGGFWKPGNPLNPPLGMMPIPVKNVRCQLTNYYHSGKEARTPGQDFKVRIYLALRYDRQVETIQFIESIKDDEL